MFQISGVQLKSFSSSRPKASLLALQMSSAPGLHERKGASRPVHVKLLGVAEVQRLNDLEARKKQHTASSPEASNAHTLDRAG